MDAMKQAQWGSVDQVDKPQRDLRLAENKIVELKHSIDSRRPSVDETLKEKLWRAQEEIIAMKRTRWSLTDQIDKLRRDLHLAENKIMELKRMSDSRRPSVGNTLKEQVLAPETIANLMKDRDKERSELLKLHIELVRSATITREAKDTIKRLEKAEGDLKRMEKLLVMIRSATNLEVGDIAAMMIEAGFETSGQMTPEERNSLVKGLKSSKRKDISMGEISKKARTDEPISIVSTKVAPIPEFDAAAPPLISSQGDATTSLPEQREVVEKKKKKKKRMSSGKR
ncbi:hypothetical protein COCNU_scaffold002040G000020 [Cocos nucifera]|nr:hypothetical protein [Cocos nucifera]